MRSWHTLNFFVLLDPDWNKNIRFPLSLHSSCTVLPLLFHFCYTLRTSRSCWQQGKLALFCTRPFSCPIIHLGYERHYTAFNKVHSLSLLLSLLFSALCSPQFCSALLCFPLSSPPCSAPFVAVYLFVYACTLLFRLSAGPVYRSTVVCYRSYHVLAWYPATGSMGKGSGERFWI
jgi:hypothetical protein